MNARIRKSETITAYDLTEPEVALPVDRAKFYDEQVKAFKKTGKPTQAVAVMDVFLFDISGELFVQKRSNEKRHNPGLFDKSIGGHIVFGDTPDFTAMVETVQELQVPSIALRNDQDFRKTHTLLKDYLETVALLKHVDIFIADFEKSFEGERVVIANKKYLYFGVYNGAVKTVDRESKGVLLYTLDDLRGEMKKFPERFTADMHYYMKKYGGEMEKFLKNDLKVR